MLCRVLMLLVAFVPMAALTLLWWLRHQRRLRSPHGGCRFRAVLVATALVHAPTAVRSRINGLGVG
jgi:hypothetical protein